MATTSFQNAFAVVVVGRTMGSVGSGPRLRRSRSSGARAAMAMGIVGWSGTACSLDLICANCWRGTGASTKTEMLAYDCAGCIRSMGGSPTASSINEGISSEGAMLSVTFISCGKKDWVKLSVLMHVTGNLPQGGRA